MSGNRTFSLVWAVAALLLTTSLSALAEADPNLWPVMKEAFFEKKAYAGR